MGFQSDPAVAVPLRIRVLVRRVMWLVSCWRNDLPEGQTELKAELYRVVAGNLGHSDLAVAIGAMSCLNLLLSDWRCVATHVGLVSLLSGPQGCAVPQLSAPSLHAHCEGRHFGCVRAVWETRDRTRSP